MRKLIFAINVSADGCCDHTASIPDDELLDFFTHLTRQADVLLYGRKTYGLMVPYWPDMAKNHTGHSKAENDFAEAFVSVPRIVVFSKTLNSPVATNTTIVRANLKDEILKLKQAQGGNILTGGVSLPSELLELGLIDEFHIVVHPVVAGKGRRLFDGVNLQDNPHLRLVESRVFKAGYVALRYSKLSSIPGGDSLTRPSETGTS